MHTVKTHVQTLIASHDEHVKRVIYTILFLIAICASLYVYFVGKIVFDVVARRSAESIVRKESTQVATLEASYYDQLRHLDLASAGDYGLVESRAVLYANRTTTGVGMVTHGF